MYRARHLILQPDQSGFGLKVNSILRFRITNFCIPILTHYYLPGGSVHRRRRRICRPRTATVYDDGVCGSKFSKLFFFVVCSIVESIETLVTCACNLVRKGGCMFSSSCTHTKPSKEMVVRSLGNFALYCTVLHCTAL